MLTWLGSVVDDRMLYNFRREAGLDTEGAEPMTGWDAEECKLKGHTTGHYLSGLALAWVATGEERFRRKIDFLVTELGHCQDALAATGRYHPGYLSAYSEEQFDQLEHFTKYPEIWAPYYTLDKIMSGLYDCHVLAENRRAEEILLKMGDWVCERLSRLPQETLDRMWSMYIAGEYGGMLGTMVKLYRLSGEERYLRAARLFRNGKLFDPMEQGCDTLEDMHANQHIPQIMGAMELYEATGEARWWKIGKNFWEIVTGGHIYCNGGVGETEIFHRAGSTCSYLTDKAAESCASYNMLRLTGQIFPYAPDGSLMDYYENTLCNHILTSCSHQADGGTTYFLPLGPGGRKEYSTEENTCCHGTGMESRFRFMEHIYARDEEAVYVNLFVPSALSGETEFRLSMEAEGRYRITVGRDLDRALCIRIPKWAGGEFSLALNGESLSPSQRSGYAVVAGRLHTGDHIDVTLPMRLRRDSDPWDPKFATLSYGPYLLAELSSRKAFQPAPDPGKLTSGEAPLSFADPEGRRTFVPLFQVDQKPYHVYFKAVSDPVSGSR